MLAKLNRVVTNIGDDEHTLSYHHFPIRYAEILGMRSLKTILWNRSSFDGADLNSIQDGFSWIVFDLGSRFFCAINRGVNSYLVVYDDKRKATVAGELPDDATPWKCGHEYGLRPKDCGLLFKPVYPHVEKLMRTGKWNSRPNWDYSKTVWGFLDRTPSSEVSQKLKEMPYYEFDEMITHTFATALLRMNSMWVGDEYMLRNAYRFIDRNIRESKHRKEFWRRFEPYRDTNEDPSASSFIIERELEEEALNEAREYAYDFYFLFNAE